MAGERIVATGIGPDDSFVAAYATEREALCRWVRSLTRNDATAEEVTQEAFLRLLREMRAGRSPERPIPWLHRVAANLVASGARRETVARRRARDICSAPTPPSLEVTVLGRESLGDLADRLARLAPEQRAIVLWAARGAPASRLAARLGVSSGAARLRLHRARAHLRSELAV